MSATIPWPVLPWGKCAHSLSTLHFFNFFFLLPICTYIYIYTLAIVVKGTTTSRRLPLISYSMSSSFEKGFYELLWIGMEGGKPSLRSIWACCMQALFPSSYFFIFDFNFNFSFPWFPCLWIFPLKFSLFKAFVSFQPLESRGLMRSNEHVINWRKEGKRKRKG